jgi:hypothetical protein
MKKYVLRTKQDEIINTIFVNNIIQAIECFSEYKRLPKEILLEIFKVEEI